MRMMCNALYLKIIKMLQNLIQHTCLSHILIYIQNLYDLIFIINSYKLIYVIIILSSTHVMTI